MGVIHMKFRSVNEFENFKFKDSMIRSIEFTQNQMIITVEGAIVGEDNSQNSRYEDMYCMLMQVKFNNFELLSFVEQGYKHYDMAGKLVNEVPDRRLSANEKKYVLSHADAAYLFRLKKVGGTDTYEFIFDINSEDDEEFTKTYQINFKFDGCVAEWDKYASPVNGQ